MNQIMLNVPDQERSLHAKTHAAEVGYLVAALSADPETIGELEALSRFAPEEERRGHFDRWETGICAEPWDAGLCVSS